MSKARKFVIDFLGVFIILGGSFLIFICEVLTQIVYTLQKVWFNLVVPFFVERMADVHFMSIIIMQGLYELTSRISLSMSKLFFEVANYTHKKSEELVERVW